MTYMAFITHALTQCTELNQNQNCYWWHVKMIFIHQEKKASDQEPDIGLRLFGAHVRFKVHNPHHIIKVSFLMSQLIYNFRFKSCQRWAPRSSRGTLQWRRWRSSTTETATSPPYSWKSWNWLSHIQSGRESCHEFWENVDYPKTFLNG